MQDCDRARRDGGWCRCRYSSSPPWTPAKSALACCAVLFLYTVSTPAVEWERRRSQRETAILRRRPGAPLLAPSKAVARGAMPSNGSNAALREGPAWRVLSTQAALLAAPFISLRMVAHTGLPQNLFPSVYFVHERPKSSQ